MRASGVGGGFFYGPFRETFRLGPYNVVPGNPGYGVWVPEPTAKRVNRGRWLAINVWPASPVLPATYGVQLGLGAPGSEALWQPSDGTDFYINWNTIGFEPGIVPYTITFPISTGNDAAISVRISCDFAGSNNMTVILYAWI